MMTNFNALILFMVSLGISTKFTVKNDRIIDDYGRESFFHGVNVIYKSFPYIPITDHFDSNLSFAIQDMELLRSLGQNIIRFGVEWPGVEPNKGEYNMTYINACKELISTAYEYNIYTLVDSHQDVLSEALCGEGAPIWATQPIGEWNFPEPLGRAYKTDENHIPSKEDCLSKDWASYYATFNTGTSFENIYKNGNGLRDSYADYWGKLANEFKDVNGIVGFELMNEPWAGDIWRDPLLVYPGVADKENLQPFYEALAPKIYGNDSDRIIFFESVTWTDEFNITIDDAGFTNVPGGTEYQDRSVFSFHYYSSPNFGSEDKYFWQRNHDGIRLNCTSMLTEFNICDLNDINAPSKTMDYVDKYLISGWIGWEYKKFAGALPDGTCTGCGYGIFYENGTINDITAKAVSRTYPMRVQGNTLSITFNYTNGDFVLRYKVDTKITEPTIVYFNKKYWYINGINYDIQPNTMTSTIKDDMYLEINSQGSGVVDGTTIKVDISSK